MLKKKIILKFPSPKELWAFRTVINSNAIEMNFKNFTLVCDCDDGEVNEALKNYRAQIVQREISNSDATEH